MSQIGKVISQAIKEGHWLLIDYQSKDSEKTTYWISVLDVCNDKNGAARLEVNMFNTYRSMDVLKGKIFFDSILSATILPFTDYEVPAFYYGDGIGEIDLMISKDNVCYATEVKPYKGNHETLLRMLAEIMTYTEGYPSGRYKKAIAFFKKNRDNGEKTAQQKEYESADPALLALLEKADITVFRLEEVGEKTYQICKL